MKVETNIKRGKIILLIIIIAILLLDAITTTLVTIRFGVNRLPSGIIRLLITATFMYYIYKGNRWLKNIFVGLLVFGIVSSVMIYNLSILFNPLMLLLLSIYSISAGVLIFSKDVKSIFNGTAKNNQNEINSISK
jgi:hypothetical protein